MDLDNEDRSASTNGVRISSIAEPAIVEGRGSDEGISVSTDAFESMDVQDGELYKMW